MIVRLVKKVKVADSGEEFQIQSKPFRGWPFWSDRCVIKDLPRQTLFSNFTSAKSAMQVIQRDLHREKTSVWKAVELWRTK